MIEYQRGLSVCLLTVRFAILINAIRATSKNLSESRSGVGLVTCISKFVYWKPAGNAEIVKIDYYFMRKYVSHFLVTR